MVTTDDQIDELPDDLNPAGFVGAYLFPDNSRRRWPGAMYIGFAAIIATVYFLADDAAVVNSGWLVAAVVLAAVGLFSISSGWRMTVDEKEALVAAQRRCGVCRRPCLGTAGVARPPQPTHVAGAVLLSRGTAGAAWSRAGRRRRWSHP